MRKPINSIYTLAGTAIIVLAIASRANASSSEQNWPQWRGPLQNGVAPSADPPVTWSETSNIKWKVKIPGEGSATPLIWGSQIFIQTAIPTGKKGEPQKADAIAERPSGESSGPPHGGFGPGRLLGPRMLADGDKNKDDKLSREEFSAL